MTTSRNRENPNTGKVPGARMNAVFLALMLLGILCAVQVIRLSIFERGIASGTGENCVDTTDPSWNPDDDSTYLCYVRANTLRPTRGEIYDDHGRLLVGNYNVFEVAFDGKQFAKEYSDSTKYSVVEVDDMLHHLAKDFYEQLRTASPTEPNSSTITCLSGITKTGIMRPFFP